MSRGFLSSIRSQRHDDAPATGTAVPGKRTLTESLPSLPASAPVQRRQVPASPDTDSPEAIHRAAAHSVSGTAGALPHLEVIQASFGRHDVRGIVAHQDSAARAGAARMGAAGLAVGNRVAFAEPPSLHTAAHEAAHVIQQRGGVQVSGGVGAHGDPYEQHADAVADLVVAGRSAEALLDVHGGGSAAARAPVQRSLSHAYTVSPESKHEVDTLLAPPPGSSSVPDIAGYVREAGGMLDFVITASHERSVEVLKRRKPLDKQKDVVPVADEAQQIVISVYGGLVKIASLSPEHTDRLQRYRLSDNIRDSRELSSDPVAVKDYLRNIMTLIADNHGTKLVSKYSVDLSREDNRGPFYELLESFHAKYSKQLAEIRDAAPGQEDPSTGQVFLPMAVEEGKEGNWYFESIQTLIHEYLHACAHPQYRAVADTLPETAQKILKEGFCDHFAMAAWKQHNTSVPWLAPYAETATAAAIAQVVGDDNCRAAYFLGHTEFLGLGTWNPDERGLGLHHVLPHDTIDSICAQHEITPEALLEANPDRPTLYWQNFAAATAASTYLAGAQKLKIPRPSYRSVPPPSPEQLGSPPTIEPGSTFVVENEEMDI